jgi:hypothetical protein
MLKKSLQHGFQENRHFSRKLIKIVEESDHDIDRRLTPLASTASRFSSHAMPGDAWSQLCPNIHNVFEKR